MAIINIQDTVLRAVCGANAGYLAPSTGIKFPDATTQITAAGSSQWVANGADIYNANAGKVGVGGSSAPESKFHVFGDITTAQGLNCKISTGSLAQNSTYDVVMPGLGYSGLIFLRENSGNTWALFGFSLDLATTTLIAQSTASFSNAQGTAGKINVYINLTKVRIENAVAGPRVISVGIFSVDA